MARLGIEPRTSDLRPGAFKKTCALNTYDHGSESLQCDCTEVVFDIRQFSFLQKVAIDLDNGQQHRLGRQSLTVVSSSVIGVAFDQILGRQPLSTVPVRSTTQPSGDLVPK